MYQSNGFRKSIPTQKRQLIALISDSKEQVDDFVGDLTFKTNSPKRSMTLYSQVDVPVSRYKSLNFGVEVSTVDAVFNQRAVRVRSEVG